METSGQNAAAENVGHGGPTLRAGMTLDAWIEQRIHAGRANVSRGLRTSWLIPAEFEAHQGEIAARLREAGLRFEIGRAALHDGLALTIKPVERR